MTKKAQWILGLHVRRSHAHDATRSTWRGQCITVMLLYMV